MALNTCVRPKLCFLVRVRHGGGAGDPVQRCVRLAAEAGCCPDRFKQIDGQKCNQCPCQHVTNVVTPIDWNREQHKNVQGRYGKQHTALSSVCISEQDSQHRMV